jgi:hypothetical protein
MNGFSFFGADRRFFAALGDSSKRSAIMYPQLLGATICVNVPSFIAILRSVFSPLMPQSALDKQRFCKAKDTNKQSASKCPYLNMYAKTTTKEEQKDDETTKSSTSKSESTNVCPFKSISGLPDFLGGNESCPRELIPVADRADRLTKMTIGARSTKIIQMTINEEKLMGLRFPCRIKYEVLVAGYGIGVGATMNTTTTTNTMNTTTEGEKEVVLKARKIKAEEGLVVGTFEVLHAGVLTIEFDNSYSYLRSKTVQFRFDVDATMVAKVEEVEVLL